MDPDATLLKLRELVDQWDSYNLAGSSSNRAADITDELVEHIKALDNWLSRGGHFPRPLDYRAAWFRGHDDFGDGLALKDCPFTNPGEAKMWSAGWWYRRINGKVKETTET